MEDESWALEEGVHGAAFLSPPSAWGELCSGITGLKEAQGPRFRFHGEGSNINKHVESRAIRPNGSGNSNGGASVAPDAVLSTSFHLCELWPRACLSRGPRASEPDA